MHKFHPVFLLFPFLASGLAPFGRCLAEPSFFGPRTLAGQVQALAEREGFSVSGLYKLADTDSRDVSETGVRGVRELLAGFDHVIVHQKPNGIQRLIIIGKKGEAPEPPPIPSSGDDETADSDIVLDTRRQGDHHLVAVGLNGDAGASIELELMVDTGASLLVLPESQRESLGIDLEGLASRTLQTAKGKLDARVGMLRSVQLGAANIEDVDVAFVDDELLGNQGLLGMNVLRRFVFILDDDNNQLTLITQAGAE